MNEVVLTPVGKFVGECLLLCFFSVCFIVWIGWQMWKDRGTPEQIKEKMKKATRRKK